MSNSFLKPDTSTSKGKVFSRQLEEVNATSQAKLLGLPYINLYLSPADLNSISLFTEAEAAASQAIPFSRDHEVIRVATTNPENPLLQQKLNELGKKYTVKLYVASKAGFTYALNFYKHVVTPPEHTNDTVRLSSTVNYLEKSKKTISSTGESLRGLVGENVDLLFGLAMQLGASDIHIEPEEGVVKVRFRVDGVLQDLIHFSKPEQKNLLARIKIIAKLKLNTESIPQDGRLTFIWDESAVDVRVSTLPSAYGEGVVMRLLGVGAVNLKIEDLGLVGKSKEVIEKQLARPNGMIITTGPTGSGKTTTLYAFLNELNEPGVKIITIEDPVEYRLEGVQQTPIDHAVDFGFAKALRAILRQDPDIVMVGEIRDAETADTALQAALTGHVVLSTLHTNDAFGAIPRLITMGVKPFVIAPAINAVIAQRLVRRLCDSCKRTYQLPAALLEKITTTLATLPSGPVVVTGSEFYTAPGCAACHGLGYKGRVGVYEVIEVNDVIKELILREASTSELKAQALTDGTLTMLQDGLMKALQGITDVEEVFRVVGE